MKALLLEEELWALADKFVQTRTFKEQVKIAVARFVKKVRTEAKEFGAFSSLVWISTSKHYYFSEGDFVADSRTFAKALKEALIQQHGLDVIITDDLDKSGDSRRISVRAYWGESKKGERSNGMVDM